MPVAPERAPLAAEQANGGKALLIIDMISAWDFPDAAKLAAGARRDRAANRRPEAPLLDAGVPTIYVNDNHGHWRSDFRQVVLLSIAERRRPGRTIAETLRPGPDDYSVLKPKHSAFFATPLDLLLRHLRVKSLIVTGVAERPVHRDERVGRAHARLRGRRPGRLRRQRRRRTGTVARSTTCARRRRSGRRCRARIRLPARAAARKRRR